MIKLLMQNLKMIVLLLRAKNNLYNQKWD